MDTLLTPEKKQRFLDSGDTDLACNMAGLGRFRVNVMFQRGSVGIVMRHVRGKILDFGMLNLPPAMGMCAGFRADWCWSRHHR